MKNFDELYIELKKNAILKMEKTWEKANKEKNIVQLISGIVALGIFLFIRSKFTTNYDDSSDMPKMIQFLCLEGVFILMVGWPIKLIIYKPLNEMLKKRIYKNVNIYEKNFKEKIILEILNNFYSDVNYKYQEQLPYDIYEEAKFNGTCSKYTSDDYFEAKFKNQYRVKMGEVKSQRRSEDSEGNVRYYTTFHGLFSVFEIDKFINCDLRISSIKTGEIYDKLDIDSMEFEKYFDVACTNEIQAMQVLTADVMEILLNFLSKSKINFDISIKNNKIYLRFDTGELFETQNLRKDVIDKASLKRYFYILKFANILASKLINIINEKEAEL